MQSYLCAKGHHFSSRSPLCPYPGCTAEIRPTAMDPSTDGDKPSFKHLPRLPDAAPLPASENSPPPGARGTCTVCGREFTVTRSGLPRHKGVTEFDLATDGMCSGSNGAAAPAPLSVPLPASSPTLAPSAPVKHSIRWWAYDGGDRIPRRSDMKDGEWFWDATCSCGWDSNTSGVLTMSAVDKLVKEHKS